MVSASRKQLNEISHNLPLNGCNCSNMSDYKGCHRVHAWLEKCYDEYNFLANYKLYQATLAMAQEQGVDQ